MNSPMKIRSNQHNVSCFMPSYQGSTEVEASICLRSQSRAKQHDTGNTTQSRAKQHDTGNTRKDERCYAELQLLLRTLKHGVRSPK